MFDPVVIVGMARTPIGSLLGSLRDVSAWQLGSVAIAAALARGKISPEMIQEVLMGCVLTAGQGQAPARQAAIAAKIPTQIGSTTVNKMCGSGMKTVMLAHDLLLADSQQVIVAGGMESMTNAPYLLAKARAGYRLGHGEIKDHIFLDGLEDAYHRGCLMGTFAENAAKKYDFSRQAQDNFAITSLERAQQAIAQNYFVTEIAPVTTIKNVTIIQDEQPQLAKIDKISQLRPVFAKDGTITAANASSISDGAAALIITRLSHAQKLGLTPLAKIIAHTTHAQEPEWFTTAPVMAIKKLFDKTGWNAGNTDLFEINEAFAVVTMAAMTELTIAHDKVNVNGGACALGHPIGASGARIVVTLIAALQQRQLKRGIASLCIGGGEAVAMAVELC